MLKQEILKSFTSLWYHGVIKIISSYFGPKFNYSKFNIFKRAYTLI